MCRCREAVVAYVGGEWVVSVDGAVMVRTSTFTTALTMATAWDREQDRSRCLVHSPWAVPA